MSSHGILKSCDHHNQSPKSSCANIDDNIITDMGNGDTIYICSDALIQFAHHILPRISISFTLVSRDSDQTIDQNFCANPPIQNLLKSLFLNDWFAQNPTAQHQKLKPLPIGLDYYTMAERPNFWRLERVSPIAQEHALISTLNHRNSSKKDIFNIYINWQTGMNSTDRIECYNATHKTLCYFE